MTLPLLDLPTLFVVSAIAIGFSGCVLILARGAYGGAPLVFWGIAMLLGAAGVVMLPLGSVLGTGWQAAGYMAILLGTALSWTGARVFAGRPPEVVAIVAGPLAWLALRTALSQDSNAVEVFLLLVGASYTLLAAAELWRGRAERLGSRRAAIVLLLLHAAVYVARAVALLAVPDMQGPRISAFLMFEAMLHTIGLAFLLLALMKDRAELQVTIQLRELAMRDGLTGLSNRRKFDEALDEEFRRAFREQAPLTLLMIDVDHFKLFNDTYGHQAGDECLRAVGLALAAAVHRSGDLVVRYGGEEFAALLPGTTEAGGLVVADVIHSHVARLGIVHGASDHAAVTVSIGIATMTPTSKSSSRPDRLVRGADRALYEAKAAGRNTTHLASRLRGIAVDETMAATTEHR